MPMFKLHAQDPWILQGVKRVFFRIRPFRRYGTVMIWRYTVGPQPCRTRQALTADTGFDTLLKPTELRDRRNLHVSVSSMPYQ